KQAGLPDGVLNVVTGFGEEAGQALSRHPDVDVMTFTGSTRTGKQLLKDAGESNMKRVWLEAGGKSANIVFADCPDLAKAAAASAAGIFYNQGQVCIAGTRLLVEASIADDFIALLKAEAANWRPGNPLDPATAMGTLIDSDHADSVLGAIDAGAAQGTLALDGRSGGHPAAVGPTLLVDVDPQARVSREEIFGPVLVITRFRDEVEALRLANDSDYGLGAAVWTRDLSRAHRMSRRLKAGSVFINNYNDGDMTVPFGGYKQSGNGRDKSLHALEKFSELKTIWIALEPYHD
ncbi:aldehyde dehydrogenase family protein, partial [uncultured Pluralibacter sp.]|uniref:aldehyde dehydrogenase family protein n=2 Tax=Enterobacterales TaxID=91347 RepID=UPI002614BD98